MNKKEQNNKCGFMKKHGKKILVAAGTVVVTGVVYVAYRHHAVTKQTISELTDANKLLREDVDILRAAASEGLYDEAIATTTRKLNFRQLRLEGINERLAVVPTDATVLNAKNN